MTCDSGGAKSQDSLKSTTLVTMSMDPGAVSTMAANNNGKISVGNGNIAKNNRGKIREEARAGGNVRRKSSTQLFSTLDETDIRAAHMIARGFQLRTTGMGFRTQSFSTMPKSSHDHENWQFGLMQLFMSWAVAVQREGLSMAAALDILVFGKSCRATDKERKKRNGFAKKNLLACLDMYKNIKQ